MKCRSCFWQNCTHASSRGFGGQRDGGLYEFVNIKALTGHSEDLKAFLSDATRLFSSKFCWNDGIDARTVATDERTRNPKLKLSVDVNICYTEERR